MFDNPDVCTVFEADSIVATSAGGQTTLIIFNPCETTKRTIDKILPGQDLGQLRVIDFFEDGTSDAFDSFSVYNSVVSKSVSPGKAHTFVIILNTVVPSHKLN